MKESDWKTFVKIKANALELYCSAALDESQSMISSESGTAHDRYLQLYRLIHKQDKQLGILFDGHSRSNALLQLISIRREGIADEGLIAELSDEFREATDPNRNSW